VFDRAFFDELPRLIRSYRGRWDVALCVKVITADDEELLVAETLEIAAGWIALVHFAGTGADATCPEGEGSDAPLAVAVIPYRDVKSVRLLPSGPDEGRAFGFRS
jgi:hypothetical protein